MILNSITLDNIRSYRHAEIEFPKGITLFVGDVGSGKSTILMSIEFALFGTGSQKIKSLLAKKADSGSIALDFTVGEKNCKITRALVKKSNRVEADPNGSWIIVDGQKEQLSITELKQRVLQVLKFNEPSDPIAGSRIFRYAVFTPQEAMKDVLNDTTRRLETVRKAFDMEEYVRAASNAQELSSHIKVRLGKIEGMFSNVPKLEEENAGLEKEIAGLEEDIKGIIKKQKGYEEDEGTISEEFRALQEKERQRIEIESQINNVQDKIAYAKNQIRATENDTARCGAEIKQNEAILESLAKVEKPDTAMTIPELDAEIVRLRKIKTELHDLQVREKNASQEITILDGEIGQVHAGKAELVAELDQQRAKNESLDSAEKEYKGRREEIRRQEGQKQAELKMLKKEMGELAQLGSVCPTCRQRINEEEHRRLVGERQEQASELDKGIMKISSILHENDNAIKETEERRRECNSRIDELRQTIPKFDRRDAKNEELRGIRVDIATLTGRMDKDPDELSKVRDGLFSYENAVQQRRQTVKNKNVFEEMIQKNKNMVREQEGLIAGMAAELDELHKRHRFEGLREEVAKIEERLGTAREKITESKILLGQKNEKKALLYNNIQRNNEGIAQGKKLQERHAEIDECRKWIDEFFIPTATQIEKQVLVSILQSFNETYGKWYSLLIDDPTKESGINEDFAPTVSQDGQDQDVEYLSGGEKTSIALAYRLTLNSMIRKETESLKSNLLILDEPTDGFSTSQLGKMRELLDELRSEQVILVSHERELEAHVDNIFEVSKHDGSSQVSNNKAAST